MSLRLQGLNQKTLTDYHRCNGVFSRICFLIFLFDFLFDFVFDFLFDFLFDFVFDFRFDFDCTLTGQGGFKTDFV